MKNDNIEGGLQPLISPNCENGNIDEGNDKFEEENSGLKAILVGSSCSKLELPPDLM